jgi:mannosyltransferase
VPLTALVPASASSDDVAWSRRTVLGATLCLTLVALVVRAVARPGRPMWFDECFTIALARYPLPVIVEQLGGAEASGGLYTLLLAAALRLTDRLGVDALTVGRSLSATFGVLAVPALFVAARRLVGDRAALVASGLLCVSRFAVYYSLEARSYSLALLLVILSTVALLELLEAPRPASALAFGLLAALATWAHLFAALVLTAQLLASLRHPGFRSAVGFLAAGAALAGAGSASVVAVAMHGDIGQTNWIEPFSWRQLRYVLEQLAGGTRQLYWWGGAALVGAAVALPSVRRHDRRGFGAALAIAWAVLPVGVAAAISLVKPLLVPRYLLVALPGFVLAAALGVAALRRPRLVVIATLLLAVLELREVALDRGATPLWQPLDRVASRLREVTRAGDAIVVSHPAMALSIDRELGRAGRASPTYAEPMAGDPLSLLHQVRPSLEERLVDHPGVVFVLASERADCSRVRALLQSRARTTDDEDIGGIRLLRLER